VQRTKTTIPAKSSISLKLLLLLAAIFTITPFAIDSYLPAVQLMAHDLGLKDSLIAMTVSLYVFGMAFGQLIGGTMSDGLGRSPVIIFGLLVFATCSVFLAHANSEFSLLFWRIIQSLGGGIAVVGVPAIIRDNADGKEAARLFALIGLIMLIAPTIAPSIGTVILMLFTWHWIFYFVAVFAIVIAILTWLIMPASESQRRFKNPIGGFYLVLSEQRALGFLFAQAFGFSTLLTFITNSPLVYIGHFGVPVQTFSMLFVVNVIGIMLINRFNVLLLRKLDSVVLLQLFLAMQLIGCIGILLVTIFLPTNLIFSLVCIAVAMAANGGIVVNSTPCFLKFFGEHAGVASGILGASTYIIGGFISGVSTMLYTGSILYVFIIMTTCTSIALYSAYKAAKLQK